MVTKTLKPCPFCGSEDLTRCVDGGCMPTYMDPEKQKKILLETPYVTTCSIECNECGARIEGYAKGKVYNDIYYKAISDCYEKWNRRC